MKGKELRRALDEDREELASALEESIIETMREAWLPNTVAWIAVVIGAFVLNLLLLVAVSGG